MEFTRTGHQMLTLIYCIVFLTTINCQNANYNQTNDYLTGRGDNNLNVSSTTQISDDTTVNGNQDNEDNAQDTEDGRQRIKLNIPMNNKIVQLDLRQNLEMPTTIPVYVANDKYSSVPLTNLTNIYSYQDRSKHASFVTWESSLMGIFEDDGNMFSIEPAQGAETFSSDIVGFFDDNAQGTVEINNQMFTVRAIKEDGTVTDAVRNYTMTSDVVMDDDEDDDDVDDDDDDDDDDTKEGDGNHQAEDTTHGTVSKRRRKKRAFRNYEVELFFIIDYSIFRMWDRRSKYRYYIDRENDAINNIRFYYAHVLNGIATRFRTIKEYDMEISIRPVGMLIAKSAQASFVTEYISEQGEYINGYDGLDALQEWINTADNKLPKFDQVSLFTAYKLYDRYTSRGERRTFNGIADIPGVCEYRRASIISDHGVFSSIQTGAHELAHSLGAFHDGYDNSCSSRDQYIMAVSPGVVTQSTHNNPLQFSWCSIQDIRENMRRLNKKEKSTD